MAGKHIHVLARMRRPKGSKDPLGYYQCAFPDCTFNSHKGALLGKLAVCMECTSEYVLTPPELTKATPKCPSCRKKSAVKTTIQGMVEGILSPAEDDNDELTDFVKGMFK